MIVMIAKWIHENFDQMSEPEKYVAWFKYLKPLKDGYFNMARSGDIEMDDDANIGMPKNWTKDVQDQMKKMKTFACTVRDYSGVQPAEPEPVSESAEQQLDRIERLLQDPGIIRNKLKVRAAVSNAKLFIEVQKEFFD